MSYGPAKHWSADVKHSAASTPIRLIRLPYFPMNSLQSAPQIGGYCFVAGVAWLRLIL